MSDRLENSAMILAEQRSNGTWNVTVFAPDGEQALVMPGLFAGKSGKHVHGVLFRGALRHFENALIMVADNIPAQPHREPAYQASEAEQRAHDARAQFADNPPATFDL